MFREVNERLRSVNEAFGEFTGRMDVVCECGNAACAERIQMSVAEYEAVRAEPDRFVVIPGHADPSDVEEVVLHAAEWEVIRKRPGEPTALAEQTDPRE